MYTIHLFVASRFHQPALVLGFIQLRRRTFLSEVEGIPDLFVATRL
jgi:hypothetical protein